MKIYRNSCRQGLFALTIFRIKLKLKVQRRGVESHSSSRQHSIKPKTGFIRTDNTTDQTADGCA